MTANSLVSFTGHHVFRRSVIVISSQAHCRAARNVPVHGGRSGAVGLGVTGNDRSLFQEVSRQDIIHM